MPFAVTWMDLESIIQSEVNQKNKYCILMYICGIQKNGIDDLVCKAERGTDIENNFMDIMDGREVVGRIGR